MFVTIPSQSPFPEYGYCHIENMSLCRKKGLTRVFCCENIPYVACAGFAPCKHPNNLLTPFIYIKQCESLKGGANIDKVNILLQYFLGYELRKIYICSYFISIDIKFNLNTFINSLRRGLRGRSPSSLQLIRSTIDPRSGTLLRDKNKKVSKIRSLKGKKRHGKETGYVCFCRRNPKTSQRRRSIFNSIWSNHVITIFKENHSKSQRQISTGTRESFYNG